MAQADSVPTAICALITGASAKASTKPPPPDRRYFIGARTVPRLWRDIRAEVEREYLPLAVETKHPYRRWYEAVNGRMPIGWHVLAISYAIVAILLGWWPWNFLLLMVLFPIRNRRVRVYAFRTVAAKESMRRRESYRRGSRT